MSAPNAFETFLRKEIEEKGAKTRADRAAIYSEFVKRIDARVGQHPDHLEQVQHRAHYQRLLDDAKAAIEADFLVLPEELHEKSFADRVVDFGKRHWKWVSGAGAVASFASEFAKPLADFTGLLAGGSAIGLIAALVMARKAKSETTNRACVSAAVVCGVFGLSSMAMLSVRAIYPDAQANGAVAKIVPGMEGLQQQVLGLDKKLGQIATSTAETARNTSIIASNTAVLKKETSEDPVKELANLGIFPGSYPAGWYSALMTGDDRIMNLLASVGHTGSELDVRVLSMPEGQKSLTKPEFRAALRRFKDVVAKAYCFPSKENIEFKEKIGESEFKYYCDSK